MKKLLLLPVLSGLSILVHAQNVGIGTTTPLQKFHVNGGNFMITQTLTQTNTLPTPGQTYTLTNGQTLLYAASDSTGKIYDPGGPAGNYLANLTAATNIPAVANCVGFEVTINSINLGVGDSLIISELPSWQNVQLAVGNNYNTTGTYVFNTPTLYISFKSNTDALVGSGFDLVFKRKFDASPAIPFSNLAGKNFLYDVKKANLTIGSQTKNELIGSYNLSIGSQAVAWSTYGLAVGDGNELYGENVIAVGRNNIVNCTTCAAIGVQNYVYGGPGAVPIFAFGRWLNADASLVGRSKFYVGEYNYDESDGIFIVGNGNTESTRHNAMVVYNFGDVDLNGYVRLGNFADGAPRIKTKKITGFNTPTTAAPNTYTFVPHGLAQAKILSISVLVNIAGNYDILPHSPDNGNIYTVNTDPSGGGSPSIAIGVKSVAQSGNVMGRPIKIFITYEE